jgi:hypothetical protein
LLDIILKINATKVKERIKECKRRKIMMVKGSKKPHHKKKSVYRQ